CCTATAGLATAWDRREAAAQWRSRRATVVSPQIKPTSSNSLIGAFLRWQRLRGNPQRGLTPGWTDSLRIAQPHPSKRPRRRRFPGAYPLYDDRGEHQGDRPVRRLGPRPDKQQHRRPKRGREDREAAESSRAAAVRHSPPPQRAQGQPKVTEIARPGRDTVVR